EPPTAFPGADERLLHGVLCFRAVPGHGVELAGQAEEGRGVEVGELLRAQTRLLTGPRGVRVPAPGCCPRATYGQPCRARVRRRACARLAGNRPPRATGDPCRRYPY